MVIDFPEAEANNPTQCIALAVDAGYMNNTVAYLNDYYNSDPDQDHSWRLQFNEYHFANDNEVSDLINKLIRVCSSAERGKNIYADLNLKELLIRLIQSQHLCQIRDETQGNTNGSRLHYVLHYINENLGDHISIDTLSRKAYMSRNEFYRWFKEQFGVTPLEYVNRERMKLAKQLLADPRQTLQSISLQCGFSDVNYFIRLFKKQEGITPGMYRGCQGSI